MTKELQDDVRKLGMKVKELSEQVMKGNVNLEDKINTVNEYSKSMSESSLYEAKRANDRIDALHKSVVSLETAIRMNTKQASEY